MLPLFKSEIPVLQLLQTKWKSEIDPLLAKPLTQGLLLPSVSLAIGTNTINHRLGRKLIGWQLTRKRAAAAIYDTQDSNQMPQATLTLVSDAVVVVDLWVF